MTDNANRWLEALRLVRWPLVAVIVVAGVWFAARGVWQAARDGARGSAEAVRAIGEGAAEVAGRFATGTITTTFVSAIPRLVPDGGTKLELTVLEASETLSETDNRRVFFDLVPIGSTVSEIRVPVTYRYHLRLDEPWRLEVAGGRCLVHAPAIRPSLPPAIHTDGMEKRSESGWLRFDEDERMAELERRLTPTLSDRARDPDRIDLVREHCRRQVEQLVRNWLLLENQWGPGRFTHIEVVFADEAGIEPTNLTPVVEN